MMKCQAEQLGNEMHCVRCMSCWDLNDSNPPKCLPEYSKSKAFANYINASLFTRLRCIWSKQQTYVNTDRHISNAKFFEGCEINGKIYQVVK